MKNKVIYLMVEPDFKEKIVKFADAERRTITAFIMPLIENKIFELENAK